MLTETLKFHFTRNLEKLISEIKSYSNEVNIWRTDKDISNSAGNLTLHLIGNLNHFIGAVIGNTGYERDRDREFTQKNIPAIDLINQIEDTIQVVEKSLNKLTAEDLENDYPVLVLSKKTSTEYFLVHVAMHLTYHLGQINYHRRLLDE